MNPAQPRNAERARAHRVPVALRPLFKHPEEVGGALFEVVNRAAWATTWISGLPPKEPPKGTGEGEGERGRRVPPLGRGGHEEASVSSGGEHRVTRGSILYRDRDPPLVARCSTLSAALPFASPRRGSTVVWRRLAVPRRTPGPREGRHRAPAHPRAAAQIRWHAYKSRFPADKPATARRSAGGHRCAPPLGPTLCVCALCAREARLWLYNIVPLSA